MRTIVPWLGALMCGAVIFTATSVSAADSDEPAFMYQSAGFLLEVPWATPDQTIGMGDKAKLKDYDRHYGEWFYKNFPPDDDPNGYYQYCGLPICVTARDQSVELDDNDTIEVKLGNGQTVTAYFREWTLNGIRFLADPDVDDGIRCSVALFRGFNDWRKIERVILVLDQGTPNEQRLELKRVRDNKGKLLPEFAANSR